MAEAKMASRIRNILLEPRSEWQKIDGEPATVRGLMTGWVLPLAAIGPVASLISSQLFGTGSYLVRTRPALDWAIADAVLQYVVAVIAAFVCAILIDISAPRLGGQRDRVRAMKVVAYGSVAAWLSGIFFLFPPLWVLSVAGVYSAYLYWTGLPVLMRVPQDKVIIQLVVVIVAMLVVSFVLGAIKGGVMEAMFIGSFPSVMPGR